MSETIDQNKLDEILSAQESKDRGEPHTFRKPFGPPWGFTYWTKWATVTAAVGHLGVPDGARVLDIGVGTGWTSLFLAEGGYEVVGLTSAPAAVEIARDRAARWSSTARFVVGDIGEARIRLGVRLRCGFRCLAPFATAG